MSVKLNFGPPAQIFPWEYVWGVYYPNALGAKFNGMHRLGLMVFDDVSLQQGAHVLLTFARITPQSNDPGTLVWYSAEDTGCSVSEILCVHAKYVSFDSGRTYRALEHVSVHAHDYPVDAPDASVVQYWFAQFTKAWMEKPWLDKSCL